MSHPPRAKIAMAPALLALLAMSAPTTADDIADLKASIAGLTPKDVGARYGQALGAVEICIGAKVTDKAKSLKALFSDADLQAFEVQSSKIYKAWTKVKACTNQDDPNQCKVIMDQSCAAAVAEIGPKGSAISGLIDPPPYYKGD